MSDYEYKDITAKLISVDTDAVIDKKGGGTYKGAEIIYKMNGAVYSKGIHEKTFEFKGDLKGQLESLKGGGDFTIHLYKKSGNQYWNVDSVENGHVHKSNSSGSSKPSYDTGVNHAAEGQAINLAVSLGMVKSYSDFSKSTIIEAIKNYKDIKAKFTQLWDTEEKQEQQAQQEQPVSDDDIPF